METTQLLEHTVNGWSPFTLAGSLWIVWFLIAIAFIWADLVHKVSWGALSIAAVITIFASFFVPVSSQLLVFCFFAAAIYVGTVVRREHHQKPRHYYVH